MEVLCSTCMYNCKSNLIECNKYDRDCLGCICENRALYDCADCEFEPEDEDE